MKGFKRFQEKTWTVLRIIKKSISKEAMMSDFRNSLRGTQRSGGLDNQKSEIQLTVKGLFHHLIKVESDTEKLIRPLNTDQNLSQKIISPH